MTHQQPTGPTRKKRRVVRHDGLVAALSNHKGHVMRADNLDVVAAVKRYVPVWPESDLQIWDDGLGDTVRGWFLTGMEEGIHSNYETLRYESGLGLHVYKTQKTLDPNVVFHPRVIDNYIFVVNKKRSESWKKKAAEHLRRVGPVLGKKTPWPAKRPPLKRSGVKLPYSPTEEAAYVRAARASSETWLPRLLFVVAALFGAGLDDRWLPHIEVADIKHLPGGRVAIQVCEPMPRLVPVRAEYTQLLLEAVQLATQGRFLDRGILASGPKQRWNNMSAAWKVLNVQGLGQIDPWRARNTWICAHLSNGTPLPYLGKLCGYPNSKLLTDLISFAQLPDEDSAFKKALEA